MEMESAEMQVFCVFRGFELFCFFYNCDLFDAPEWTDRKQSITEEEQQQLKYDMFDLAMELAVAV